MATFQVKSEVKTDGEGGIKKIEVINADITPVLDKIAEEKKNNETAAAVVDAKNEQSIKVNETNIAAANPASTEGNVAERKGEKVDVEVKDEKVVVEVKDEGAGNPLNTHGGKRRTRGRKSSRRKQKGSSRRNRRKSNKRKRRNKK